MKQILSVTFLILLMAACESDVSPSQMGNTPIKIKEINRSVYLDVTTKFLYHSDGRLSQRITDIDQMDKIVVEYEYDSQNKLISLKYPDGSHTDFEYDAKGNLIASTVFYSEQTPAEYTYRYFYGSENRPIKIERYSNRTVELLYDIRGNLKIRIFYSNAVEVGRDEFLEYDNKPNPFKGNFLVFEDRIGDELISFSSNNLTKWRDSFGNIYTNEYEYNRNGFWIKRFNLINGSVSIDYH
jgi:YD repeat-containing protein